MDWNLLKSFLAVAQTGSLSAASAALGTSQPTLGRHISELEHETGLVLFIRGRSGMALTEAALGLLEEARQVEVHVNRLALKAKGRSDAISGTVRLTASDVVSTYILPDIIARLGSREPQIEVEIVVSNRVENLLLRDADIAIRMVRPVQPDVIAIKVNDLHMGAYAAKSYLAGRAVPQCVEDIYDHRLVGYDRSTLILDAMKDLQVTAGRHLFTYRTDNQVAYWELVKAGAGVGFGPNFIAAKSPHLQRLVPDLPLPSLPMWLASHSELRTSNRIRRVMDFLGEELRSLDLR